MEKIKLIKTKIEKYSEQILFIIVLLIALIARGYQINCIPIGIHVDEAGMAYDAFCLATNGTDRFLHHLPVYLENFGGGQSALYACLAAIFVKVIGLRMIAIRLPALLLGIGAIVASYFMTRKECGKKFSLLFIFLIATCPFLIMSSRFGLDCNLFSPMVILATFCLLRAKKVWEYILAGIVFGLTLYTYALSYMILPIYLFLILVYMLYTKKIKFKYLFPFGIPLFLLALPLMLMLLVNNGYINEFLGFISIIKMPDYRGSEISLSFIKDNLGFLKVVFDYDGLPYNAIESVGAVFVFSKFLIIMGFFIGIDKVIKDVKKKTFSVDNIFFALFVSVMGCMLVIVGPNINKANAIYIPAMYFIAIALRTFYRNYKIAFWILLELFILYFAMFEYYYFTDYVNEYKYQNLFEYDYLMAIKYVGNNEDINDKKVHVLTDCAEPYIYTLYIDKITPQEFNNTLHMDTFNDDLYSYGKYYFRDETYDEDAVYIIKNHEDYINELKNKGFYEDTSEFTGIYHVLYKK